MGSTRADRHSIATGHLLARFGAQASCRYAAPPFSPSPPQPPQRQSSPTLYLYCFVLCGSFWIVYFTGIFQIICKESSDRKLRRTIDAQVGVCMCWGVWHMYIRVFMCIDGKGERECVYVYVLICVRMSVFLPRGKECRVRARACASMCVFACVCTCVPVYVYFCLQGQA